MRVTHVATYCLMHDLIMCATHISTSCVIPSACSSSVGTELEDLLPDPPQWSANPVTKQSSSRSSRKAKTTDSGQAAAVASTAADSGSTDQVMMVFDEELGEFVPATAPTVSPPPTALRDRRTDGNRRHKRKRSGRPPTHNGGPRDGPASSGGMCPRPGPPPKG